MNDAEVKALVQRRECEVRIQHLNFELDRLKRRYRQSRAEIDSHKKNCEDWLRTHTKEDE